MAFFFLGTGEIGRVERCGNTWVATEFVIFNLVALIPRRSFLHVEHGTRRPIPLHLGSIAAAYARTVPLGAALLSLAFLHGPARWIAILVSAVVLGLGFLTGRLSAREKAKRFVTGELVGAPVSLAHIKDELPRFRQDVDDRLAVRLRELGAGTRAYRGGAVDLESVATLDDDEALRLGFVLARIDAALAASDRAIVAERALWKRLSELGFTRDAVAKAERALP